MDMVIVALFGVACRALALAPLPPAASRHVRYAASGNLVRNRGSGSSARMLTELVGAPSAADEKLVLIDGHALAYRMFFALQKSAMSTRDGRESHALHGFLYKVMEFHENYPAHRMIVAFDLPGATFRSESQSDYKAQRPSMPMPLRPQIEAMKQACECLGMPALTAEGFEADDVIATCVAHARESGASEVVIVSSDKDLMQLVSEEGEATEVVMFNDAKKLTVDAEAVERQFGVRPAQICDLLSLMGDASDNVPGVPGVGPKGAAKLLLDHGDLEDVLTAATDMKPSKRNTALMCVIASIARTHARAHPCTRHLNGSAARASPRFVRAEILPTRRGRPGSSSSCAPTCPSMLSRSPARTPTGRAPSSWPSCASGNCARSRSGWLRCATSAIVRRRPRQVRTTRRRAWWLR